MTKNKKNSTTPLTIILVIILALYFTNPTEDGLRSLMRSQKDLKTQVASHFPINRENYFLFSKFEIKYGIGKKTCYGAFKYVIICPSVKEDK